MLPKTRPDDFKGEIEHIANILDGQSAEGSPISLERGLDTMLVIAATHMSHRFQRTVYLDYDKGYRPNAIETH